MLRGLINLVTQLLIVFLAEDWLSEFLYSYLFRGFTTPRQSLHFDRLVRV